mmetsp:Transcript_77832/g.175991  ORF Transcript_77832/g.175991 Transcript_77832/m.175991 type:complete len:245 (-) Transcript_77832:3-737(-)
MCDYGRRSQLLGRKLRNISELRGRCRLVGGRGVQEVRLHRRVDDVRQGDVCGPLRVVRTTDYLVDNPAAAHGRCGRGATGAKLGFVEPSLPGIQMRRLGARISDVVLASQAHHREVREALAEAVAGCGAVHHEVAVDVPAAKHCAAAGVQADPVLSPVTTLFAWLLQESLKGTSTPWRWTKHPVAQGSLAEVGAVGLALDCKHRRHAAVLCLVLNSQVRHAARPMSARYRARPKAAKTMTEPMA